MAAPVTEADLLAFVDGRLADDRVVEVEHHLAANPDDRIRIAADIAIQDGLRQLFGDRRHAWADADLPA